MPEKSKGGGKQADVVLTAIARDRPGVVEQLAAAVASHGGNWVDSSMTRLGGEFAGIVRIEVPAQHAAELEKSLTGLAKDGIDVTFRMSGSHIPAGGQRARLELTGLDHTGIVLEVTRTLAKHGVSIDELNTAVTRGSMGAEPMFSAEADIVLPEGLGMDTLRDALELIARDIMVDIELSDSSDN